jgi:transposase-like protein
MGNADTFSLDINCPHCGTPLRLTVERTEASAPVTWTCPRCRKSSTNDLGGRIVRIAVRYEEKAK